MWSPTSVAFLSNLLSWLCKIACLKITSDVVIGEINKILKSDVVSRKESNPAVSSDSSTPRQKVFARSCLDIVILESSPSSNWLHRALSNLRNTFRQSNAQPHASAHSAVLPSPDEISAYVERLDTTTLPFAIDAMHVISLLPPHTGDEYLVLDNACGTGAAGEYAIEQFEKKGMELDIALTDHSAVMMAQVATRREQLNWGQNVKSVIMDAQVAHPFPTLTMQALKFQTNTFTHIFLTFGIMLIPDYDAAIKSLYRVLRQNGRVAITVWKSQGHWAYLTRAARHVFQNPSYPAPSFFDEKWLDGGYTAKILSRHGFRYVLGCWRAYFFAD
jgi:ubiquinone/menaquinone biosynthesis C-methylase UbiE